MSYRWFWRSCVQWKTPRILFWDFPAVAAVMKKWNMIKISFQACMSGSTRNRWTSLGTNSHLLWEMDMKCDKSHPHDPWGFVMHNDRLTFATKFECDYQKTMCDSAAKIVTKYMKMPPDFKPMRAKAKSRPIAETSQMRPATGRQHRKFFGTTNIPDRKPKQMIYATSPFKVRIPTGILEQDAHIGHKTPPKRVLSTNLIGNKTGSTMGNAWQTSRSNHRGPQKKSVRKATDPEYGGETKQRSQI